MKRVRRTQMTGAALVFTLFVAAVQLYLFETVLGSVLDGQRGLLPGAFAVSCVLTAVALYLAFKAPGLDR
jgi:urea transporter